MKTFNGRIYYLKNEVCDKCKSIFKVGSKRVQISYSFYVDEITEVGKENRGLDVNSESTMLCENCAPTMYPEDIEFYFQFKSTEVVSVTKNIRIDDYK